MSIQSFYAKGNITRTEFPVGRQLPLYLGSGKSGCCIDGYGLMNSGVNFKDEISNSVLNYKTSCHYARCKFELDAWIPLYHLAFKNLPQLDTKHYKQTLDLYKGKLTTAYQLNDGSSIKIRCFFSTKHRNTLSVIYEYSGTSPELILAPIAEVPEWYGGILQITNEANRNGFTSVTNTVRTRTALQILSDKGAVLHTNDTAITLTFNGPEGKHLLLITAAGEAEFDSVVEEIRQITSIDAWENDCEKSWAESYGSSYVDIPDDYVSAMTARSIYYIVSSFAPGDSSPSAPMGWSGYGWPFHFPQDISFIHPAMLRLGMTDLAKAIVDYYRKTLTDMERITKRIYGGSGAMWAWEYPIHPGDDLMKSGSPNIYQFEIHNAAYPARMAYETALQLKDDNWTEKTAKPIIKASAEFFASHLIPDNGKWSLHVIPSMSQDELASENNRNYLCALYSARYTFRTAVKMGLTEYQRYLDDGLNFDLLIDKEELLYKTSEEMHSENWGKEKHPVQLNPLIFLPADEIDEYEKNAYKRRAFICAATREEIFYGWTPGAFWLAASHNGDSESLYYELHRSQRADFVDPDQLTFYESTNEFDAPYYVTTHGFWLQAVLDAFVCDYSGETQLCAAVPKRWQSAEFHNLHTKDGKVHSGGV